MFNREYRDMAFLRRWGIVRKLREQSVGEHSYLVAMYANDFCSLLGLPDNLRLRVLQYALWHDVDEIFSDDTPGPFKRAAVADKAAWKDVLAGLMQRVFGFNYRDGRGGWEQDTEGNIVEAIVKAADWLEAACEMATEVQFGNRNCEHHMHYDQDKALEAAEIAVRLCGSYVHNVPAMLVRVEEVVREAVRVSHRCVSEGPLTDPAERAVAVRMGLLPRD